MGGGSGCCICDCCVGDCGLIDRIKDFFCSDSGCCVGYNSGPSETEKHATKIANELASMKEKKRNKWNENEGKIVDHINTKMNGLLNDLEKLNQMDFDGKSLNIDLEAIRTKTEEMKKQVVGSVGRVLEDRLVLTDNELSVIMAEKNDKKRTKAFDGFCKKIQKEALQALKKKISEAIKEQNELIKSVITTRIAEVSASIQQENEAYSLLLESKKKEEANARMQVMHIYLNELASLLVRLSDEK